MTRALIGCNSMLYQKTEHGLMTGIRKLTFASEFDKFDPNYYTLPVTQTNVMETSSMSRVNMTHGDHC